MANLVKSVGRISIDVLGFALPYMIRHMANGQELYIHNSLNLSIFVKTHVLQGGMFLPESAIIISCRSEEGSSVFKGVELQCLTDSVHLVDKSSVLLDMSEEEKND